MVGFAVCLADVSNGMVVGNNIRSFMAGGRRRSKMDDGTYKARVAAGERGGFRPVDQCGSVPSDRYRN